MDEAKVKALETEIAKLEAQLETTKGEKGQIILDNLRVKRAELVKAKQKEVVGRPVFNVKIMAEQENPGTTSVRMSGQTIMDR